MKVIVAFVLISSVVSTGSKPRLPSPLQIVSAPSGTARSTEEAIDFCSLCVQFSGQAINQVLNIILNAGVVGGCSELCGLVPGGQIVDLACNLLCDYVGIKVFIQAIEDADLDPIYFCELIKTCKVFDEGDATITEFDITPKEGPQGTTFHCSVEFVTRNGTGTGEFSVNVETVDGVPVGTTELMEPLQPGSYGVKFNVKASSNGCDPSQNICETWLPGKYNVTVSICNGECGSKHPHSEIYDTDTQSFHITK
jgi:hypothetical protein